MIFLLAHEAKHTPNGTGNGGIAQVSIQAKTLVEARKGFERHFPERIVTTTGVLGRD